jgi:P27 family predicted phage terminase small subunit
MGKRGPKATPTRILKLRGSWRADTRLNEPKALGMPRKPLYVNFSELASRCWDEMMVQLEGTGVLSRTDTNQLARYCLIYAEWIELRYLIEKEGSVYQGVDESGRPVEMVRAAAKHASRLAMQLTAIEREFGLTPSARTAIKAEPVRNEAASKAARFFKGIG